MQDVINFVSSNWGVIFGFLFAASELIALSPLKSNSVFQLLFSWLKSQQPKQ